VTTIRISSCFSSLAPIVKTQNTNLHFASLSTFTHRVLTRIPTVLSTYGSITISSWRTMAVIRSMEAMLSKTFLLAVA
jgi:hypothetical protein